MISPRHEKDESPRVFSQKSVLCERCGGVFRVERAIADGWRDTEAEKSE